jgi:transcription elongation GreA/GreB family factor
MQIPTLPFTGLMCYTLALCQLNLDDTKRMKARICVADLPEKIGKMAKEEREEWFLEALEAEPMPVESLLGVIQLARDQEGEEQADGFAEMMCESLVNRQEKRGILELMKLWSQWRLDAAFADTCSNALTKGFKDRLGAALVKNAGFDGGVTLKEALRRLDVLLQLSPGVFCHDNTWGFGVVSRLDDFYGKATIDFDGKRGHQLSFAYAAETLEIIGEDHLYVRRHKEPERLSEMVKNNAAEVVRITIRSLGEMTAPDLKDCLVDGVMPEADWKRFWDAARRGLKEDPLVDIPAKRSEPIRLLQKAKEYDSGWFAKLAAERSREGVIESILEFEKSRDAGELDEEHAAVIGDRIAHSIRGLADGQPELLARFVVLAARLGLAESTTGLPEGADKLLSEQRFVACAERLSVRDVNEVINYLAALDLTRTVDLLLHVLEQVPVALITDMVEFIEKHGRLDDCIAKVSDLIGRNEAGVDLACWLCKNLDVFEKWQIADHAALVIQAIESIEADCAGVHLKGEKQLRELLTQTKWLKAVFGPIGERQRELLLRRVEKSIGWDESGKRSVLARLIKLFPELASALDSGDAEEESASKGRYTSWRTLRQRQEQFRKLVEEDIPANSKEIGVARSYGDLRENFEYQAAKDHQRLLMQRKAEMEADLEVMQGTDFANVVTSKVAMGVEVILSTLSGDNEVYRILGEWDRDETLEIVSSKSLLAEKLMGCSVGDEVMLPSAEGERMCHLEDINALPDEVRAWLNGG